MIKPLRFSLIGLLGLFLAACTPEEHPADITAVARDALVQIQRKSIREGLEYCGSVVRRADGQLYATAANRGRESSCPIRPFFALPTYEPGDKLVASYHTHSSYNLLADSEVPSVQDMDLTARFELPGYISTPGGRFWYMQPDGKLAYQICGVGCLPQDPNFVPGKGIWTVPDQITRRELANRGQ